MFKRIVLLILTVNLVSLTHAQDCTDVIFDSTTIRCFEGDLSPISDNNEWIKFDSASPSSSKSISSCVINNGDLHSISFNWDIEGLFPEFFRMKICIDGEWFDCDRSPFFIYIDNDNTTHTLEWVLEHDKRPHVGTPPTASASIGNIRLCGLILGRYGPAGVDIERPAFKHLLSSRPIGSILDSYSLGVEVENIPAGSEIKLWTQEGPAGGWNYRETRIFNGSCNIVEFKNLFFSSWGEKRFKFLYGDELYSQEGMIEIFPVFVEPESGANKNEYLYKISGVNSSDEDVILRIRDSDDSQWATFSDPDLEGRNLTFTVPTLDFIESLSVGTDIDYEFVIGGREIGPFKGPHISELILNPRPGPGQDEISIDFQSELCGREICLKYNNHTISRQNYTMCNQMQTLIFPGIDPEILSHNHDSISLGDCNE